MVRRFDASEAWWARARRVIPLGTQTLSKHPSQWVRAVHPTHLVRGRGAHLWDVDGNEWIDEPMALGPILLGYAEPVVDDAIRAQLDDGITFTLMHPLEVEVAERIVAMCPGVERVRFAKSGSDATSAAIRAARAHTGRDRVISVGYHGWHDWYIGSTTRDKGVPAAVQELTSAIAYGDLDALTDELAAHPGEVAAVILEPSGATVPRPGYLQGLVDACRGDGDRRRAGIAMKCGDTLFRMPPDLPFIIRQQLRISSTQTDHNCGQREQNHPWRVCRARLHCCSNRRPGTD